MMKNNEIALINYYARLIKKGTYTIDQVEERLREEVEKKLKDMPDVKVDEETETPALGQSPTAVNKDALGL